jgi:hypothetical protein
VKIGFAHVYIKADNLIEGRLRAQIALENSHFVVLERITVHIVNPTQLFLRFQNLGKNSEIY